MEKYIEVIKTNMQISFMYKWNVVITSLMDVFKLIAECAFWQILFATSASNEMYGYTLNGLITYYIFMYIIGAITGMGSIGYKVADDIKNGTLSNILLKTISCIKYYFSEIIGQKIVQLLFSLVVFIPIFIIYASAINIKINLLQIFLFPFAIIFALVLTYLINLLISFLAFWLTEVTSFFFVKDLVVDFLSGKAFPIDIMPVGVLGALNLLPFAYCTFFPINILTKDLSSLELMRGFGMQLGWILVIYVMVRIAWKKGIKRYSGTGM
jgi:ABC-2 type transport system permease protein